MLGRSRCGFHIMCVGTHYAELVFLHPVGIALYALHTGSSGAQNVITQFFMLGQNRYGFDKMVLGHITLNLCFCIWCDLWVTWCIQVHSGCDVDAPFFKLESAQCPSHEKRVQTRYAKLVFLHPVGSSGSIVHSGASGAQNGDTQFFKLGSARCGFYKKRTGKCYTELIFLHHVPSVGHIVHSGASGHEMSMQHFLCSSGPGAISTKLR
jgi:hypothetical protein